MRRGRLVLAAGAALLLLGCVGLARWPAPLVKWAMRPSAPFASFVAPAAPDYRQDSAWTALPDRVDGADALPPGLQAIDPAQAPADVFYVHPTSYLGPGWNGPVDDPELNAASARGGVLIQASAFNGCCAVYAPSYRQANGIAFLEDSADGALAQELAYADLRSAFSEFHRRRGPGRPFLVVAHSQGAFLAERLLLQEVSGTPLRDWLVAAWLPGGIVGAQGIAPDLPPCRAPAELHCVTAWNARRGGYRAGPLEILQPPGRSRLCTNPLTWRTDQDAAPASANLGAVFLDGDRPGPVPAFADARCDGEWLRVDTLGEVPRDPMSQVLAFVIGSDNLHPVEVQLFWSNIRENAATRVGAALRELSAP